MDDYEKLGAFYLGRRADTEPPELVLYDSKDLTTHAVIVGMTGSGKTGLGITLIEEAALDRVPVLVIDPKGDLGNLLLTFPELRGADFEPWIDPRAALEAGMSAAAYAARTAETWRRGLADWGQQPERIEKLRTAAEAVLYTPGSGAGRPVAALSSLDPPGGAAAEDPELYRDTLDATAASLLSLAGIDADPLTGREHVLLANVLDHAWRENRSLDLPRLVAAIQTPPFDRLGVVGIDAFMPPKARLDLAMRFNALLASPSFAGWLEGAPLEMDTLLFNASGKPQIAVMSIAHLGDAERMFFVSMLLGRLIAWMRRQPGTPSLRAVLYMDEVFGFMPPVANPPSKRLLLTLLKQARAHGLGVVLATQNPVDLDYKGLANAGTWFIGRMQTERDKARMIDGLTSAAGGERLAPAELAAVIAGLGKRRFLLHNVHDAEPFVFETRWAMSYLAGPLTRAQIKLLVNGAATEQHTGNAPPARADGRPADGARVSAGDYAADQLAARPVLPAEVPQRFFRPRRASEGVVYVPRLVAAVDLEYRQARLGIDMRRTLLVATDVERDASEVDWSAAERLDVALGDLDARPVDAARYIEPPALLMDARAFQRFAQTLKRWLRDEMTLELRRSPKLKLTSEPGESEAEFRIRLQHLANERRDAEAAKLRQRYESKAATLIERLRRAEHALERERQQAAGQRLDAAVSIGTALLGAMFGRRRVSATTASRIGTAVRRAGRTQKERGDAERAADNVDALKDQIDALERKLEDDAAALDGAYDAQSEPLDTISVKPRPGGVHIDLLGIGWTPRENEREV